ncbi:MAG: sugar kinase [bacterium]
MEILCCGILVADAIGKPVEKLPNKGELSLLNSIALHVGGCAANTGIGLAKIGIKTGIMGCVGEDNFGKFIEDYFVTHKIDIRGIIKKKNIATSATLVLVSSQGERSFLHYIGANQEFSLKEINYKLIEECKIFHIGGAFLLPKLDGKPMENLLKKVQEMKKITSLDSCWDDKKQWDKLIKPCLKYVDIFLPSIEEAKKITHHKTPEKIAETFINWGVKIVGLKMGIKGSYIRTKDTEIYIPSYSVKCIDATGAGDSFVAGFLTGIIKGWNLEKTGKFANAVGALCVQEVGSTKGIKSLNQTLQFIKDNNIKIKS